MTTLPIRLDKGDPAPEDCIAVPLHGPGASPAMLWRAIARQLRTHCLPATAKAVQAIADAAEAPRPLRRGDRVQVGEMSVTVQEFWSGGPTPMTWIKYDDHRDSQLVPTSIVTRIDGKDTD